MNCKCGSTIVRGVCCKCGNEYDTEIAQVYNDKRTEETIKRFVIENSSVREFSSWGQYYEFEYAGAETLQEYAKDCIKHKNQVEQYLKNYTNKELVEIKNNLLKERAIRIADSILKTIGYKFEEEN